MAVKLWRKYEISTFFELLTDSLQAIDVINGNRKWGAKVYKSCPEMTTSNLTVKKKRLFMAIQTVYLCKSSLINNEH